MNYWIFDLDNTLYSARDGVFNQISERMGLFVAQHLELHIDDARKVQKRLFHQYGTTLCGMMREHDVDPVTFMQFVHDVDLSAMPQNPVLQNALTMLDGQKIIYTNASRFHAARILNHLGLADHFEQVFDIMSADYRPKPDPEPYQRLVTELGIDPTRAIMVEDMVENLRPAKMMGMRTIWVDENPADAMAGKGGQSDYPDYVDYRTDDLARFLQEWRS